MEEENISIVVDATHPYAALVSENIVMACAECGCRYIRLQRAAGEITKDCVRVSSLEQAVEYLEGTEGAVLAATGSRDLEAYTKLKDYRNRVTARVLSVPESVTKAVELGFSGKNLICMQGPFRREMNEAMLRGIHASYMVTKESGKEGGFQEKLAAARNAGVKLIVVERPAESGQGKELFPGLEKDTLSGQEKTAFSGSMQSVADIFQLRRILAEEVPFTVLRRICLAGIGMGSPSGMTLEVLEAIRQADVLIGAGRMLRAAFSCLSPEEADKASFCEYRAEEICTFVKEHPEYEKITVLLSGDTGFYSGARRLMEVFASEDVRVLPGISSVSALSAALKTSWEDAPVLSLHGCRQNVVGAVRRSRKVFVLTGGKESFEDLCRDLLRYGLGQVLIEAGCDLSYPQERILRGRPEDFLSGSAAVITGRTDAEKGSPAVSAGGTDAEKGSAVLMITNPAPDRTVSAGMEDSRFSRILAKDRMQEGGKTVPMTKREIRALILSFLQLEKDSIIYDVGAGTGSVSIECALRAEGGHVWAIECREDAAELIRKNQRVIGVSNLTVICGSAPEAMEGLPVPDRVFIGGSGGKLEEILQLLCRKNPALRLVISAVTLETLSEALRCLAALPFKEPEIVSITAARARKAGNSHLMTGQNPVYLITAEGRG